MSVFQVLDSKVLDANLYEFDAITTSAGVDATASDDSTLLIDLAKYYSEISVLKMLNKGIACHLSDDISSSIASGTTKNGLLSLINEKEGSNFQKCEYVFSIDSFLQRCATTITTVFNEGTFEPGAPLEFIFKFKTKNNTSNVYKMVVKANVESVTNPASDPLVE